MKRQFTKEDNTILDCYCINISAGGVAFFVNNTNFELNETVQITFCKEDFEKEIVVDANIIKIYDNSFVAKYSNLKPHDEDKIVKYVFKLIAKK